MTEFDSKLGKLCSSFKSLEIKYFYKYCSQKLTKNNELAWFQILYILTPFYPPQDKASLQAADFNDNSHSLATTTTTTTYNYSSYNNPQPPIACYSPLLQSQNNYSNNMSTTTSTAVTNTKQV